MLILFWGRTPCVCIQYMYYHFCPEKNTKNKKEIEEVGRHSKMLGEPSVISVGRTIVVSLSWRWQRQHWGKWWVFEVFFSPWVSKLIESIMDPCVAGGVDLQKYLGRKKRNEPALGNFISFSLRLQLSVKSSPLFSWLISMQFKKYMLGSDGYTRGPLCPISWV